MSQAPKDFDSFRAAREAELVEPYGWLTLTGFHWLSAIPSPLPDLPGLWSASAEEATVTAGVEDSLRVAGQLLDGSAVATVAEYGRVPWVEIGTSRVELLRRGGRLAVRVRALTSAALEAFDSVATYPYDEEWVVTGRFTAYPDPRSVEVACIRPDLRQVMHPIGDIEFEAKGEPQRLAVTKGKYGWGVEFFDPTNGIETEQWRQLHFDEADADGQVHLDFNRTLNMWFAFTDFATCPAPIPSNVITVPVRAGELPWRDSGARFTS